MIRCVPVLLALIGGATLLGAQQPTFRGGTHTVSVYATVVDRNGRLVPDLTKDDFEVYDNGKLQTLTVFKNDIQPITIVIMLDRSGSMKGNFPMERAAAQQFIAELLPDDKARLGSFSHRVQIDPRNFTSDRNELTRILRENLLDEGPTPLWNATYAAMNALAHQDGRRVVLVFTDGYDSPEREGRNYTLDDVITRSQAEEIMVYAIGLSDPCEGQPAPSSPPAFQRGRPPGGGGRGRPPAIPRFPGGIGGRPPGTPPIGPIPIPGIELPPNRGPVIERPPVWTSGGGGNNCGNSRPDSGLKQLAEEGGGGYFELRNTDNLAATFSRVADELHHQYLLAFKAAALDGKIHTLEVRVKDSSLNPRARRSYLAPLGSQKPEARSQR